jgi:hypothetical protein
MNQKIYAVILIIVILCVTALISQCSYRYGDCQNSAIKAGLRGEDLTKACRS